MFTRLIASILLIAAAVSAFRSSMVTRTAASSLKMAISFENWNNQKVVTSPVDVPSLTPAPELAPSTVGFPRKQPYGAGMDERHSSFPTEEALETEYETVSKIDKSLRQYNLLMALKGDNFGEAEKLLAIERASGDGALLSTQNSLQDPRLEAGGLFDEWEFDME